MPKTLSKKQVAKLDEAQLEAYANIHLNCERSQRLLYDKISGRSPNAWVPAITSIAGLIAVICFPSILRDPLILALFVIVFVIVLLFDFHTRTNRRIDALVSLLEIDRITAKKEEVINRSDKVNLSESNQ